MTLTDWRDVPSDVVQPLLLAERRRVLDTLHWDVAASFRDVEHARQRGDLPGLLLHDASGRAVGWAFYGLSNRLLQIGGLYAPTAGGLRALLDRILTSPEAELAAGVSCFLEARNRSLTSALTRLRFDLQRHAYLEATLTTPWPTLSSRADVKPLALPDAPALVRLLARSYAGDRIAQTFAPSGRIDEWAQYAGQLLNGPAVGIWQADQSFAVDGPDGHLAAAVVTTEIARGISHVAQVVVDPRRRRQGLARTLLLQAATAASTRGAKRLTLMVGEDNHGARALYASLGFVERGTFVFGTRGPVPRTLGGVTMRATGGLRATA